MSDPIWFNNIKILFSHDRLTEFFPTSEQTTDERLNAIVRLSMYLSIILFVYHSNVKYLYIFVFFIIFTYIIRTPPMKDYTKEQKGIEKLENELIDTQDTQDIQDTQNTENPNVITSTTLCTKPTIDNPFMNVTMKDYLNIDPKTGKIFDRPPACNPNSPDIKKKIDEGFNNNLFKDVSDVFGKLNSQRNYYTTPSTTIPNNRESFANWLYLAPKTCKEDQDYCLQYEDIRGKRPIFYDSQSDPKKNVSQ